MPSKLLLEKLDGARQRGLRHVAPLACASEIQFLGHRGEIPQLMHFHDDLTGMVHGGAHVTIESMAAELANARTACALALRACPSPFDSSIRVSVCLTQIAMIQPNKTVAAAEIEK
jgi:hypothetical protein